jgi:hypothetical protein
MIPGQIACRPPTARHVKIGRKRRRQSSNRNSIGAKRCVSSLIIVWKHKNVDYLNFLLIYGRSNRPIRPIRKKVFLTDVCRAKCGNYGSTWTRKNANDLNHHSHFFSFTLSLSLSFSLSLPLLLDLNLSFSVFFLMSCVAVKLSSNYLSVSVSATVSANFANPSPSG